MNHDSVDSRAQIDHLWIRVADLEAAKLFYGVLAPYTGFGLRRETQVRAQFVGRAASFSLVTGAPTMNASYGRGAAAASPFYGVMFPVLFPEEGIGWAVLWAAVYAVAAAALLSAVGHGALIVLQRETGLEEVAETGVMIHGDVSADLLGTIFTPKSPLHDGAVILCNRRITAAPSPVRKTRPDGESWPSASTAL